MKPAAADWASRKSQSAATSPMGALARSVKRVCLAGNRCDMRVCQRSRSPARQRVWASLFRRGRRARSSSCIALSTCRSNNLRHQHRSFFSFTFPGSRLAQARGSAALSTIFPSGSARRSAQRGARCAARARLRSCAGASGFSARWTSGCRPPLSSLT